MCDADSVSDTPAAAAAAARPHLLHHHEDHDHEQQQHDDPRPARIGQRGERRIAAHLAKLFPMWRRICESHSVANRAFFRPPNPPLYDFTTHGMDEAVGRIPPWQVKEDVLQGLRLPETLDPTGDAAFTPAGNASRQAASANAAASASSSSSLPGVLMHGESYPAAAPVSAAQPQRATLGQKLVTFANAISQYHRLFNDTRREPPICDFLRRQAQTRKPRMIFVPWSETYVPPSKKSPTTRRSIFDGPCTGCMGCSSVAPTHMGGAAMDCDHCGEEEGTRDGKCPFIPCLVCPVETALTVTLYFHGNGGDLGMVSHICQATATALNTTLIAVEYPAFGICNSTPYGTAPSEEACVAAALRVLRYVLQTSCSVSGESTDSIGVTQPTEDVEETLTAFSAPSSPSTAPAGPAGADDLPPFSLSPDRSQRRSSTSDPSSTTESTLRIERVPTVSAADAHDGSGGIPGTGMAGVAESSVFSDTVITQALHRHRPVRLDRIILFGQSIGTGVAMQLYRLIREGAVADLDPRRNVAALILHSPFTSLKSVVSGVEGDEMLTRQLRETLASTLTPERQQALATLDTLHETFYTVNGGLAPKGPHHPAEGALFAAGDMLLRQRFRTIDVINDVVAQQVNGCGGTGESPALDLQQGDPQHHLLHDAASGVQLPPFFIVHGLLDTLIPVKSALVLAQAICVAPRPAMPAEEPQISNEFRLPGVRLAIRPHANHNGILALEEKAAFVAEVVEPAVRARYLTAEGHPELITPYFARALVRNGVPAADAEATYCDALERATRAQACHTCVLTVVGVIVTLYGSVVLPVAGFTDLTGSCASTEVGRSATLNAIGAATRVGLTVLLEALLSFFQPTTGIHLQPPQRKRGALVLYAVGHLVLGIMYVVGIVLGGVEGWWLFASPLSNGPSTCWSLVVAAGATTTVFGAWCLVNAVKLAVQSH